MTDSLCLLIPVYNHADGVRNTISKINALGLTCIVVNDGSDESCRQILEQLDHQHAWLDVVHHGHNEGKGAAVKSGLCRAQELGFCHVLQVDADEQHDLQAVPAILALSAAHPGAVVLGTPCYDSSIPRIRLLSRYLTHFWVWVNTLSFSIPDAMCGFRVYPVERTMALLESARLGNRMEFDIEVLVRLHWAGTKFYSLPVKVIYPTNGVSHFRMLADNWCITKMHTRMFFGMLRRIPSLIWRGSN